PRRSTAPISWARTFARSALEPPSTVERCTSPRSLRIPRTPPTRPSPSPSQRGRSGDDANQALGFQFRPGQRPPGYGPALDPDAQRRPQLLGDRAADLIGHGAVRELEDHGGLVQLPIGAALDHEFNYGWVAANDVLDLTRVAVHATNGDHVIDAAADAAHDFHERAAA